MGNHLPSNSGNNNHRHYRYLHYITYQEEKGEQRIVISRRCLEIPRCRLCFPPNPPPLKSVLMHEGVREGSRTIISLIALLNEFIYVDQGPGTRDKYRRASENSLEKEEVIQLPSPFQKQQQKFLA